MILLRVLHAEALKMKRTLALKMVVIAPISVGVLILFMTSQAPFPMLRRNLGGNEWLELTRANLVVWALLMLPLFITLETALMAGIDHADNQWKSLLTRPVPRWTWYVAKLLVLMVMTAASTLVLLGGVLAAGVILPMIQPEVQFGAPVPWGPIFAQGARVCGIGISSS